MISSIIESMSQIIGFVYNFLLKLIKMSNKTWENLFKKGDKKWKKIKKVNSSFVNEGNKN